MDYREIPVPEALDGLVKTAWTLEGDGATDRWITHEATPDGCLELIRRLSGRSVWQTEQPVLFVAGLIDAPAALRMTADARFVGLRLWPWAWNAIGTPPCPDFVNDWRLLDPASPAARLLDDVGSPAGFAEKPAIADAILGAGSVAELCARSGRSHRWLQRWFAANVGIPPRRYLRLLRFQDALTGLREDETALAAHAAKHGFADQAHMAREFRAMAGQTARTARRRARGPFL